MAARPPDAPPPSFGTPTPVERSIFGGRYEILGLLGAGGMGNVYKARDLELEDLVALKVLRREVVGAPGVIERFRREVKLARRVTHANVARVFDIGEHEGERFLTMELVDGEPLSAILAREGRLGVRRAVDVAFAVCAGLEAAHAAGVLHRDLKPDNVLVARDGRVVVTDFGIARALAEAGSGTTGGLMLGAPTYMAPEQVEGREDVDARADVYALGAVLYELLTGAPAWQASSILATAAARLLHPPPDPRQTRAEVPPALSAIVLRCMARRPEDRYPSAEEVARALAAVSWGGVIALPAIHDAGPAREGAATKHVAVLPFRNAGPPEQDYIAEGLTEDLIDLLSMAEGLRVRARGSVMRYRGAARDPREIGRELDVQVVVEGTVRRAGGLVRIGARLVSVADGVQLWAKRFDRPEAEIFAINDDTARAIAEALTATLIPPERAPVSPEAIDLYLRARSALHQFFGGRLHEAAALYERAVALAPDDPLILAGYATALARLWAVDAATGPAAQSAAARAAERAPNLPESHVALAVVRFQAGDPAGAVRPLRRALRLAPGSAEAHELSGRILAETPRLADARRHLETALALEPTLQAARVALARTHLVLGAYGEAEIVLEADPEGSGAGAGAAMSRLCLWRRDTRRAAELLPRFQADTPPLRVTRALFEVVAHGTPPYDAFPFPDAAARIAPRTLCFFRQLEAEAACFLGDHARALAAVERAGDLGLFDLPWMDACPLLEPLRGDPRFLAVRAVVEGRAEVVVREYLAPEPDAR